MQDLEWNKTNSLNGNWEWGSNFCNVKLACNYFVFDVLSRHLAENPQIKRIVEFGSSTGGMALYLGMESVRLGIEFYTYNILKETTEDTDRILDRLGVRQHICDIFEEEKAIVESFGTEPVFLVADAGNKWREIERFAQFLPKGSILVSHDYGRELMDEMLELTFEKVKMLPLRCWEWNEKNVQMPVWKILSEPLPYKPS